MQMWLTWKYGGNNHISVEKLRQDFRTIMCSFSFSLTFWVRRELWNGKSRGTNYTFVVLFPIIHHNHRLATWIVPHTHTPIIFPTRTVILANKNGGARRKHIVIWYQITTAGHGSCIHKVVQDLEHMQSLQIHLEDRFRNYIYIRE